MLAEWRIEPKYFAFTGFLLVIYDSTSLKLMAPEKPLHARAFDHMAAALLNSSWLQAMLDVRCSTIAGSCRLTHVGWFDWEWIYRGWLLGFLYGQYFPELRFRVTSRKSVSMKLISMVIWSSLL